MSADEVARASGAQPRSRRSLLRAVAVGGAAVAAAPFVSRPAPASAADTPPQNLVLISRESIPISTNPPFFVTINHYEGDVGQITLGGILLTYVSAPLSARGQLSYSMANTRTETMRTITEDSRQISSSFTLGPFRTGTDQPPSPNRFGFGGTFERVQGRSTRVTNALTHSSTNTETLATAPVAGGGHNTWDHTAFFIMARPVMGISAAFSDVNGAPQTLRAETPVALRSRFINGGIFFPRAAFELRDDPGTRDFLGAETADAILAQYPLRPDQTSGVQLGLGGPRFGPPTSIAPGSTPFTFSRSMTNTSTNVEENSRSVTTRIKAGFSLTLGGISVFSFETNRSFTTVHTSVQETTNTQVVTTTGTLSSSLNHLNNIYEDKVWNTLLITDEGPLGAAFNAVTGEVTDVEGSPIGGAVVTTLIGGVTHETFTDDNGRYTFRLRADVKPGKYQVTCAGKIRAVTISRDKTATADYRRVSVGRARERTD